jgi:D-serine deaminase-like pyridoxal phosphate-dependent protein
MTGSAYFHTLAAALARAGCFQPTLVIDKARLDANIDAVKARLPSGRHLRLVDKSLAVPALIRHLMNRLDTRRIMSFHLPIARAVLATFPDCEVLFGKPMPSGALQHFFATAPEAERLLFSERVVHLADSAERLDAYRRVAAASGLPMRFAAEIDVGMHRGGFENPDALRAALSGIAGDPLIRCAGLMGYEAHVPKVPGFAGGAAGETALVHQRYRAFLEVIGPDQRAIVNIGGSKTALGSGAADFATEVSMGSAFLMPTDFDGGELTALQPAFFIATPVLKVGAAKLPGPPWVTRMMQRMGRFPRKGCYLYGGKWMARPVHPSDLKENALWGTSSNQQFFALADNSAVKPDDFAFFRPTQSEAVLQHFGPVRVFDDGRIVDEWPPLPPG